MNWSEFLENDEVDRATILKHASLGYFHPNGDEIMNVEEVTKLVEKIFRMFDNGKLKK